MIIKYNNINKIANCSHRSHEIVAKCEKFEIFGPFFNDRKLLYF